VVAGNIGDTSFNFQSAQGTPATAGAYRLRLAGGDFVRGMGENIDLEETTGNQMRDARIASTRFGGGPPEFMIRPRGIAGLLYGVLGTDTPSGSADPWTHVITPATTLPWMTWWANQAALDFEEASDAKISQLVISGNASQPIRVAATVMACRPRHQTAAETTVGVETLDPLVFYHGDGALELGGVAYAGIGSFTCTINRNCQYIYGDGLAPIGISEGLFTVDWQIGRLYATSALRQEIMYGATPSNDAEVIDAVHSLGSPGIDFTFTAAAGRSLQLECPNMTIDPYTIPPNTDGSPLQESIPARAISVSGSEPITATVLNDMADLTP